MSTGLRCAWAGALLLLVVAAGMIGREIRQREHASAALTRATQHREEARQRMKVAEQRLALAERESRTVAAGTALAAAPTTATETTGTTAEAAKSAATMMKPGTRDGKIRPEVAVATDPALRALQLQVFDEEFAGIWGPLLQRLNLPAEKAAALKALLRAHEERRMDVTAVAGELQLELGDAAIQKMRNADGALLARQTLELLGPDDGKIYQQYRRDLALQPMLTDLAAMNFRTGTPLTGTESQQLLAILSAHSERLPNGFVRPNAVNWAEALAQVERSGAFSPASLDGFRHLVAEQQVNRQIGQRWDEIGTRIMGPIRGELWMASFPALQPKPWTGAATIPQAH